MIFILNYERSDLVGGRERWRASDTEAGVRF